MERVARAITEAALGRDPGPMAAVESLSHQVFVGADTVVKLATGHTRLDREIALVPRLPAGLSARLLAHGTHAGSGVRFACYARVPGAVPSGLDAAGARSLAEQAVRSLRRLHSWVPDDDAAVILKEPIDHGGFVSRAALHAEIERIAAADENRVVPAAVLGELTAVAETAPPYARVAVPVHADCHWGNWLAAGGRLTALLDFEWARMGEPSDDWFFVISSSEEHRQAVLEVVARETSTSPDVLRAECEVRHATHLASDLRLALTAPEKAGHLLGPRLSQLADVVVERLWWRG